MISAFIAQAGVPFPSNPSPSPSLSSQIPETMVNQARGAVGSAFGQGYAALQNAAGNIDPGYKSLWDGMFGPGTAFALLLDALRPLLMVGFMMWAIYLLRDLIDHGFLSKENQYRFGWLLLTLLLFSSNGNLLGQSVRAMNEVVLSVNQAALNANVAATKNKDAIRTAQLQIQVMAIAERLAEDCKKEKDSALAKKCREDKIGVAVKQVKENNASWGGQALEALGTWVKTAGDIAMSPINAAFVGILLGVGVAFNNFIRISLMLWASSAPLWLSITLFPMKTRGLVIYITGVWGLGLILISHTLVQGIIAQTMAIVPQLPLVTAITSGLFAPILAIIIGAGSGTGIFMSLSGVATYAVKSGFSMASGFVRS